MSSNNESLFKNKSIRLAFAFLLASTLLSIGYYLYSSSVNNALVDAARTESAARDRATDAQDRATKKDLFVACKKNGWGDCERYDPYPKDTGIKKDNNP